MEKRNFDPNMSLLDPLKKKVYTSHEQYNESPIIKNYRIKLTPYAKVFYDEWLLDVNNNRYNMLCADHMLFGKLDINRLDSAVNKYISEHLLLNSHICSVHGEPYWIKNKYIRSLEYSATPISQAQLLEYVNKSFDLHKDPLYRFKIICIEKDVHRFIVIFHHLVMDGISLNEGLFKKLSNYYNDLNYVEKLSLSDQINFINNLQKNLCSYLDKKRAKCKEFWSQRLVDVDSLDLKFLRQDEKYKNDTGKLLTNPIKVHKFSFSGDVNEKLKQIKKIYQISPFFYGQCIFSMVLHRYSRQGKFVICYPIAIKEGMDFIYGGQVNLNLIPYLFNDSMKIFDLFNQAKEFFNLTIKDETKYGYYPITDIMLENPNKQLLDVYFAQAYFRDESFEFEGIKDVKPLNELAVDGVISNMLLFENEPFDRSVNYRIKYDSRTTSRELLLGFINCFKKLYIEVIDDLLSYKNKKISYYSLLSKAQAENILHKYETREIIIEKDETIQKLFEIRALQYPDNIAIVYNNNEVSYRTLNEKANQLANYLLKNFKIIEDDLVLLCLDKSDLMIVAILAVLKASAAYVPIGDYPEDRVNYILEDAAPRAIIVNQKYAYKFKKNENVVILDSEELQSKIKQENSDTPDVSASSDNLIYVLYTSGTTGKPKGVMQQHNNVTTLFKGTQKIYHFSNKDVWLFFHSYVFDFSVWEIFGALLYGGKLIIPSDEQVKDSFLCYQLCKEKKITILNQTPSAFHYFQTAALKYKDAQRLLSLRYIIFGGEALNFSGLSRWFMVYSDNKPSLVNMYGITEATVHTTYRKISKNDQCGSCIGSPIPGKNIYLLDKQLRPLPIGAIGEIYVSGGIARGYLNQTEMTKQNFIANPFSKKDIQSEESVLYKTGDLARMLPSGDIEYIGRKDFQVKIRGHRIELGEIENVLNSHPCIEHVTVLLKTQQTNSFTCDKYLVAYYVSNIKLCSLLLKDYVAKKLPDYMQPNIYIPINKIPLTINGKLDVKALPTPEFVSSKRYEAPINQQEIIVCEVFAKILDVDKVGVNDDFFELGGNSLKAISLTLNLQRYFEIKVADVFNMRTPRNIAKNKIINSDLLILKLENLKSVLKKLRTTQNKDESCNKKLRNYLSKAKQININNFTIKPITNVLLTGATGYLGSNILRQLLKLTKYNIYLLIRASNMSEAVERLEKKYHFYFDTSLKEEYNTRVFIVVGDIEETYFGLAYEEYEVLAENIDSIIHSAALVKHYAHENQFYSANVDATANLLHFCNLTFLKDFHYISTCSVAFFDSGGSNEKRIFTENDLPTSSAKWNNTYNQTKYLGEAQTVSWRNNGINSNIYRVGNLAFIAENWRTQENIQDNSFMNWLTFIVKLGCLTDEIDQMQISEVDLTARAIVKIFDKNELSNCTYHVFNPNLMSLEKLLKNLRVPIVELPINQFIDSIIHYLKNHPGCSLAGKFLLHQGWLESDDLINKMKLKILQDKTEHILKQLDFRWSTFDLEKFYRNIVLYANKVIKR